MDYSTEDFPDLVKTYLFKVIFKFHSNDLNKAADLLSSRAKAVTTSGIQFNESNSSVTIRFDEFQDFLGYTFWNERIMDWRNSLADIEIIMYNSDLSAPIAKLKMKDMTPVALSGLNLDQDDSSKVTYLVTLTSDVKQAAEKVS